MDFLIGEERFLGRGLGDKTLVAFMDFLRERDQAIASFVIDPEFGNTRAKRVYEKAGFVVLGQFARKSGHFHGVDHWLMKKSFKK